MDLMHYHHVQMSNDAPTAFEHVKVNKDIEYKRYNLTGSGWYNGAIYPDSSILLLVATVPKTMIKPDHSTPERALES
jgi:hypothetical protein